MSGYELDEAVSAIQEAVSGISAVSKDIGDVKGKQDELLETIRALSERVTNIEQRTPSAASSKKRRIIPLYERVSLCEILYTCHAHILICCSFYDS